jgi:hypothetical protein
MKKQKRKVDLAVLKYVDNSTSKTEIVTNIVAHGILFDPLTGLWHCTNNKNWWGKTQIGVHQLYVVVEGVKTKINFHESGAVICLFNRASNRQVKAMQEIALEAVKPQLL